MNGNTPRHLGAVDKTVDVIQGIRELEGAGVTELANHLDLPKTTVHAHLSTLEYNQLVVNEGDQYQLSFKFTSYGEYVKQQHDLYEVAPIEVDRLSEETGELANLLVEQHGLGVYLYRARPERGILTKAPIGGRRPLHCTGVGKAVLAYLPDDRVGEIIGMHGLEQMTNKTITDKAELLEEIETIRDQGYAIDDEEIQRGLRCVGAPILTDSGEVLGGISVTGPIGRLKGDTFREEIPEKVMSAANVIEVNVQNIR